MKQDIKNEKIMLETNKELKFEIIVISNKYENKIIYLNMSKNISEKEFIDTILKNLDEKYFNTLVKLSCCQCYCESADELIPFLLKSNGKYYFNNGNLLK